MKKGRASDLKEVLAEARAIFNAYRFGAITEEQAKARTKPHLKLINSHIEKLAKEYKQRPKFVYFRDLGNGL